MNEVLGLLVFPVMIAAGWVFGWNWPVFIRRVTRGMVGVFGLALLSVILTGIGHRSGWIDMFHHWMSPALIILGWYVVPFSMGVRISLSRRGPYATAGACLVPLALLGVIFLATITGYLGPSHGQINPMSLQRFRVMHYGVWPVLAVALAVTWFGGLGPKRNEQSF